MASFYSCLRQGCGVSFKESYIFGGVRFKNSSFEESKLETLFGFSVKVSVLSYCQKFKSFLGLILKIFTQKF